MAPVREIQTGAKEPISALVVGANRARLTGLTNLKLFVSRKSDGYYFDWSDNTFKLLGSVVQLNSTLAQVDPLGSPGLYHLHETPDHINGDFDFSKIAGGKVAGDHYVFTAFQDGAPQTAINTPQAGEVKEGGPIDYLDQAISDNATPAEVRAELVGFGLDHLVSVNPGAAPAAAGTFIRQIIDSLATKPSHVVLQTYAYNQAADRLEGVIWVESGNLVFNDASLGLCTVKWYDKDGVEQFTITDAAPDAQGFYKVEKAGPGLAADRLYYATAEVVITGFGTVSAGKGNFTF